MLGKRVRLKRLRAFGDRRMTYIAAFPCREGYVCCADTLETVGDEKQYVEKLEVFGDGEYPFCVGGAGVDEIITTLTQGIAERVLDRKPQGATALGQCIRAAVRDVYTNDVPIMVLPRQHRTPQLLIAANASVCDSDFCLFHVTGRLVKQTTRGIIGYATANNNALLTRFHDAKMPMSQAVMLAVYLVSQSKLTDAGVGGGTTVAIVSQFLAKMEDKEYIESIEARIKDFLSVTDLLFWHLSDPGLSRFEFENKIHKFMDLLQIQRELASEHIMKYLQHLVDSDKLRTMAWPYSKIPLGTTFEARPDSSGQLKVSLINNADEMWKRAREAQTSEK
jgi:hypothetical protein